MFSLSTRCAAPLSAAQERGLKPKDTFKECAECPEMVVVPPGKFTMGSPANESGRFDDEGPQHVVTIGRPFAIGKFHVTVDQFAAFVDETHYDAGSECVSWNGSKWVGNQGWSWRNPGFRQSGSEPAVCLNWDDAKAYVDWLARKTGKRYRLLTEAEWEYAARARIEPGSYPRYWFGNDEKDLCRYGNGADQEAKAKAPGVTPCNDGYVYTAPVGSFPANEFGLHDMFGNAWQWTADCWHDNYKRAPDNGSSAWTAGDCSHRVGRGGAWNLVPRNLRAATRDRNISGIRSYNYGFRVARTLIAP
jgi:formylglycine-generating enzyme required for sulfatase activity